jgi:hypothetical protein
LRLPDEYTIDSIPEEQLEECYQLVKDNSIEGRLIINIEKRKKWG